MMHAVCPQNWLILMITLLVVIMMQLIECTDLNTFLHDGHIYFGLNKTLRSTIL
jgi:hypothetical protein